jgi:chromosome segregation ATPase
MASKTSSLRSRLFGKLVRFIDFRVAEGQRGLDARVVEQEHCTADHRRRLDALEADMREVRGDQHWTRSELDRLMPHVAAQDGRIEDLREQISLAPSADSTEQAAARSLIEEIQRQHAQIRVRLAGIARYEDRLRKLEEQANVPVDV